MPAFVVSERPFYCRTLRVFCFHLYVGPFIYPVFLSRSSDSFFCLFYELEERNLLAESNESMDKKSICLRSQRTSSV